MWNESDFKNVEKRKRRKKEEKRKTKEKTESIFFWKKLKIWWNDKNENPKLKHQNEIIYKWLKWRNMENEEICVHTQIIHDFQSWSLLS